MKNSAPKAITQQVSTVESISPRAPAHAHDAAVGDDRDGRRNDPQRRVAVREIDVAQRQHRADDRHADAAKVHAEPRSRKKHIITTATTSGYMK